MHPLPGTEVDLLFSVFFTSSDHRPLSSQSMTYFSEHNHSYLNYPVVFLCVCDMLCGKYIHHSRTPLYCSRAVNIFPRSPLPKLKINLNIKIKIINKLGMKTLLCCFMGKYRQVEIYININLYHSLGKSFCIIIADVSITQLEPCNCSTNEQCLVM